MEDDMIAAGVAAFATCVLLLFAAPTGAQTQADPHWSPRSSTSRR
jgi:hypothetical protein